MNVTTIRYAKVALVAVPWVVVFAFALSAFTAGIIPVLPKWFSLIALGLLPIAIALLVKAKLRHIRELKNLFGTRGMTPRERRLYWSAYLLIAIAFLINSLIDFKS